MKEIILSILMVPGFIVAYALILRPFLSRVPVFQKFYSDANGFWGSVWAMCGNSLTILWQKIVGGIGLGLALLEPLAGALGDPDFKSQISSLSLDPKYLGYIMMGISLITIAARVRSLGKGS